MRKAEIKRKTKETDISVRLSLDGGECDIDTGIGFFNHMLKSFSVHGNFGLSVTAHGDLEVDEHHTVEDTGIVIGKAFSEALGDKSGIERYGNSFIPMDEALAFCAVDISGRPYLIFDDPFGHEKIGVFDACLISEFFHAVAANAGITLHMKVIYGRNLHHMAESLFKAFAHAMKAACTENGGTALSTKGVL